MGTVHTLLTPLYAQRGWVTKTSVKDQVVVFEIPLYALAAFPEHSRTPRFILKTYGVDISFTGAAHVGR